MLNIVVFNVKDGQSILVYPENNPEHVRLIDCHESDEFSPIDFIVGADLLPSHHSGKYFLGNLTLTNYDHDHFSGLPKLVKHVHIDTVTLAKNIEAHELLRIKPEKTKALETLVDIKNRYNIPAERNFNYNFARFHLDKEDFDTENINTNHLSQLVFVEYGGSTLCVAGDLERPAWEKMLQKIGVQKWLAKTDVMIAPHHGRDNGYHEGIFDYATPEVIVISDKPLMYGTQDQMTKKYAQHASGINFGDEIRNVLTTRNDGHILISFSPLGDRSYQKLDI